MKNAFRFISQGILPGKLEPQIDKTFSLDDVQEAHQYLEPNEEFAKALIVT